MSHPTSLHAFLCLLLLPAGCSKNVGAPGETHTKKVAPPVVAPLAPITGSSPTVGSRLHWKLPAGWKSVPPRSRMRRAELVLPGVDGAAAGRLAVFHFPGSGGGVMDNVRRWLKQFKPTQGAPSKPELAERSIRGLKITTVYYQGTYLRPKDPMAMGGPRDELAGWALLAAIVRTPAGPWFFKATGPEKTMAAQRQAFDELVASIELAGPGGRRASVRATAAPGIRGRRASVQATAAPGLAGQPKKEPEKAEKEQAAAGAASKKAGAR